MAKKAAILIVVIALVTTSVMVGCGPGVQAIDLVPQDANFVVSIKINKIVSDTDLEGLYQESKGPEAPETLEDALNQIGEEYGVNLSEFTEVLIFTHPSGGRQGYFGIILSGPGGTISSVKQTATEEMTELEYEGSEIYTDERIAMHFLSGSMMVCGTMDAVEDVIDVSGNRNLRLSGILRETYDGLPEAWVRVAMEVPEVWLVWLPEQVMGIPVTPFSETEVVGYSFNKAGQAITTELDLYFSNSVYAGDAYDVIVAVIAISGFMDFPEGVAEMLHEAVVGQDGRWVRITLDITITEIEELIGSMEAVPNSIT